MNKLNWLLVGVSALALYCFLLWAHRDLGGKLDLMSAVITYLVSFLGAWLLYWCHRKYEETKEGLK